MSWEQLRQRIGTFEDRNTGKGATLAEVAAAEAKIGLKIWGGYEMFLRHYGWARFAHEEIFGLGFDVPAHLNLVANTRRERASADRRFPGELIPFLADGAGSCYCIDLSVSNTEPRVVFWDHESNRAEYSGDSFEAWLFHRLEIISRAGYNEIDINE